MSSNEVASLILTQSDEVALKPNISRATKNCEFDSHPKRRSRVEISLMSSNEVVSLNLTQSDEVALKPNLCRATKL